jgi:hypothetical protein
VIDLPSVYGDLARPFDVEQLEREYRDALRRGEADLPPGDPGTRPLGLLASAIPRLNAATIAAYVIEVFPAVADSPEGDALHDQRLNTFEHVTTGALLRCHLAMDAELTRSDHGTDADAEQVEDWFPLLFEEAQSILPTFQGRREDQPLHGVAEDATVWLANAIDLIDARDDNRIHVLSDCLARLLAMTIFATAARRHFPGA